MTSREIVLSGIAYVRSRDAARIVHLAPDYISRLARGRLIEGQLLDGLWFVSLDSLRAFIAEQERQKELWRHDSRRNDEKSNA